MSTSYRFIETVKTEALLKAAEKLGFTVGKKDEDSFCLTNGESYLWFYHANEEITGMERFGANYCAHQDILDPLARKLKTTVLSEHDDGFFEDEEDDDEDNTKESL